jgi:hypothetical protein
MAHACNGSDRRLPDAGTRRIEVADVDDAFRETAESIAQDAQIIERIEDEKTKLDADDPRASELSNRVAVLAEQLQDKALRERDLVDIATGVADAEPA